MPYGSVASIIDLGVEAVELAHSLREVSLWCFDYQVIVVVHQTVGVAQPVKSVNHLAQDLQEHFAIPIVIEDVSSGVTPGGYMVNRTVKFHSERTSHDASELSKQVPNSKIQDLTLKLLQFVPDSADLLMKGGRRSGQFAAHRRHGHEQNCPYHYKDHLVSHENLLYRKPR